MGVLAVVYLLGVQLGFLLAGQSHSHEDLPLAMESLWESYIEPLASESELFNRDDDPMSDPVDRQSPPYKVKYKARNHNKPPVPVPPEPPRFAAPETLRLPKPIINVGFPKAGTSTIFSFFHCNGLQGQHWYCCEPQELAAETPTLQLMSRCVLENLVAKNSNQDSKRQIMENCGEYDFYSEINGPRMFNEFGYRVLKDNGDLDSRTTSIQFPRLILPQHHYLPEIHAQFPNATFLLNVRPTEEWVNSVMNWRTTLEREIPNEFLAQSLERANYSQGMDLTGMPPLNLTVIHRVSELNQSLAQIVEYHTAFVRQFVRQHPSHALVEVDITDPKAGQKLAEAFGLNDTCWGHVNHNTHSDLEPVEQVDSRELRKQLLHRRVRERATRQSSQGSTWGFFGWIYSSVFGDSPDLTGDSFLETEEVPVPPVGASAYFPGVDMTELKRIQDSRNHHMDHFNRKSDSSSTGLVGKQLQLLSDSNGRDTQLDDEVQMNDDQPGIHKKDEPASIFDYPRIQQIAKDEFESYTVGDTSAETQDARKQLYQRRMAQLHALKQD
eukprot:Nitzschia sp. Nitz4//scaffold28_size193895//15496//17154//NITZ4_001622-RA/size193895-processed-gene-0.3-mRNA-1//1//CDS//3329545853//5014//frame0